MRMRPGKRSELNEVRGLREPASPLIGRECTQGVRPFTAEEPQKADFCDRGSFVRYLRVLS